MIYCLLLALFVNRLVACQSFAPGRTGPVACAPRFQPPVALAFTIGASPVSPANLRALLGPSVAAIRFGDGHDQALGAWVTQRRDPPCGWWEVVLLQKCRLNTA